MTEQIEVFGQFDVRRDDLSTEPETGINSQIAIDQTRITSTFGGDQLNAALDAIKKKKNYKRGFENQSTKFYISRKDCPVRNFCEDLAGPNKRAEAIQMFDALFWSSWIACNEMPEQAKEWLDARVKEYKDGIYMDFICDCRKFRGNDADKTQASEMTRAEYPFDCHGYTLKKYIEEEAKKYKK
ncbi:hypothetical protein [Prochlorococcus marinus]|uniref:hypothetical protein n=1 Tax=Prochlorococcus marinus TaxID=1219 RepID=UPI001C571EED|nr:hypothetical protein [Prochlorococcus marinus]MBW3042184.1 hypothetical protein [Prochlorococcus marinus str. XMU1408]